jgi:hypothetical protein
MSALSSTFVATVEAMLMNVHLRTMTTLLRLRMTGSFQLLSLLPLRNAMAGNFTLCACT